MKTSKKLIKYISLSLTAGIILLSVSGCKEKGPDGVYDPSLASYATENNILNDNSNGNNEWYATDFPEDSDILKQGVQIFSSTQDINKIRNFLSRSINITHYFPERIDADREYLNELINQCASTLCGEGSFSTKTPNGYTVSTVAIRNYFNYYLGINMSQNDIFDQSVMDIGYVNVENAFNPYIIWDDTSVYSLEDDKIKAVSTFEYFFDGKRYLCSDVSVLSPGKEYDYYLLARDIQIINEYSISQDNAYSIDLSDLNIESAWYKNAIIKDFNNDGINDFIAQVGTTESADDLGMLFQNGADSNKYIIDLKDNLPGSITVYPGDINNDRSFEVLLSIKNDTAPETAYIFAVNADASSMLFNSSNNLNDISYNVEYTNDYHLKIRYDATSYEQDIDISFIKDDPIAQRIYQSAQLIIDNKAGLHIGDAYDYRLSNIDQNGRTNLIYSVPVYVESADDASILRQIAQIDVTAQYNDNNWSIISQNAYAIDSITSAQ